MINQTIILKLQQRLSKLSSSDYENLEIWMYLEAFNKAQINWIRRQLEGINQTRTGAETTTRRIDDLEFILTTSDMVITNNTLYWSTPLPNNYLQWCRISANAIDNCCPPRRLVIFESTEADRDVNLGDNGKKPNYAWATTFATISSKIIRIYTNNEFGIQDTQLAYYRVPANIEINGVADPYTGAISTTDVLCEAPDNVIELMIDEAVSVLASDIKDYQSMQVANASVEHNT